MLVRAFLGEFWMVSGGFLVLICGRFKVVDGLIFGVVSGGGIMVVFWR